MIAETPDPTVEPVQPSAAALGIPMDQGTRIMVQQMLTAGVPPEKVVDFLKQKGLLP